MKRFPSLAGLAASIGCLALCAFLLFANPYTGETAGRDSLLIVGLAVGAPACLALAASLVRMRLLMLAALIWSTPYGLYLSLASVPSVWNLFLAVLLLYGIAAATMKPAKRLREREM
ncbi:hypothetical protein [Paenibacillus arenilitoris]|uniref:Lipoprotein n=1 Tax=Paenibacillus arenilitoris TaxID=2772299 RepID=A0A927CNE3_9BACL|nr:hypothetical protein [Paenibacillus arenilitoris]MBD2869346.1 hypothetical protein [Paenibacillus arenilitoris]